MDTQDPFRHHPGLRDLIRAPADSFFRDFTPDTAAAMLAAQGLPTGWITPADRIDRDRRAFLSDHAGDLWVFGYGSLMWDPAIDFAEVRRARLAGYHRAFCLIDDTGGRGQPDAPGVVAALDTGGACDGLAFRIPADRVDDETRRLWFRERILPAYLSVQVPVQTAHGPVQALAFVADHAAEKIVPELPWAQCVRYAATGAGILGSSLDYVASLAGHFDELDIADPHVTDLLAAARAFREADPPGAPG